MAPPTGSLRLSVSLESSRVWNTVTPKLPAVLGEARFDGAQRPMLAAEYIPSAFLRFRAVGERTQRGSESSGKPYVLKCLRGSGTVTEWQFKLEPYY